MVSTTATGTESFDCIIVGAGISGLNCAYRLKSEIPNISYVVLEARDDIGGTWDVWRYPGVRCDSDISTIAFRWHDFAFPTVAVGGDLIQDYLHQASSAANINPNIRFRHEVTTADWTRETQQWRITVENDGQRKHFTSRFLVMSTGYYNYTNPPDIQLPNLKSFKGRVINPQFWPQDYDWKDDKVAVIGSGATAVSLVPALPQTAAQVTMIQRSPTYICPWDNSPSWAHKYFPLSWVYACRRLWCTLRLQFFVYLCKAYPAAIKDALVKDMVKAAPSQLDPKSDLTPNYKPWDQRMLIDPESAFLKSLHLPNVELVTGEIDQITGGGIAMRDGKTIVVDTIVAATGFRMELGGGMTMRVDGEVISWKEHFIWNGTMMNDVPNMVFMLGYQKNSWTLGIDDSAMVLVRLIKHMQAKDYNSATPRIATDAKMAPRPMWDLTSTYRVAADPVLPVHGDKGPWLPRDSPVRDWLSACWGDITRDIHFS